ncbi:unnamed protein product [Taenia asiatica]|uniref:Fibronectin type-III domain-containing protein n=1 Tax=Taenia asiatica TaxID=60517 RepID=A0A0R3WED3_TAEAS|nr:unnamed protein product [Taenia asiatica]
MEKSLRVYLILLTTSILHGDSTRAAESKTDTKSISEHIHLSRVGSGFLCFSWDVHTLVQLHVKKVAVNVEPSSVFGVHRFVTADVWKGEVTADELDAYTLYNVTVEATGDGVRFVHTMEPTQTWPTAPSRIPPPTGRGISRTQIEVEWKAPSSVRGILQPYELTCSEGVTSGNTISVSTEDNETTSIKITDLRKSMGYVCIVTASTVPADDQDPKECVRKSDPSSPIRTLDTGLESPSPSRFVRTTDQRLR